MNGVGQLLLVGIGVENIFDANVVNASVHHDQIDIERVALNLLALLQDSGIVSRHFAVERGRLHSRPYTDNGARVRENSLVGILGGVVLIDPGHQLRAKLFGVGESLTPNHGIA